MLANKKLDKELLKKHHHQEIIITGSRWFEALETFGIWLHIMAFILGIFALTGIAIDVDGHITHYLEMVTIVIVGLIILQHGLMPSAKRIILKSLLDEFWGEKEIATSLSVPTVIDTTTNFGNVKKAFNSRQIEATELKWTTVRWFPFKRVLTVRQSSPVTEKKWKKYAAKDGTLNTAFLPLYIIIDIKSNVIKFQGRVHILYVDELEIEEKRVVFTFHYKDRVARWTGVFPDFPLYGEWIWDSKLATKIKHENEGKRKQDKVNSKAVSKVFKEK